MKILIHMGDAYPDSSPDAERMRTFYEVFKQKGHEVSILAPTYEKNQKAVSDVFYCKTPSLKDKSSLNRLLNQIGFGFSSFSRSFDIGDVDVVITSCPPALISPFGWLIAKFKRAKLVYDVRDIWPDVAWEMGSFDRKSLYSRVFAMIRNFMLKHADLVTTVSKRKVKKLRTYAPKASVMNITNGLDEDFLHNSENEALVRKYHLDDKFTCIYDGNIGLAQGLMQMMHLAKMAKERDVDAQFLLFGTGVEVKSLKEYAKENGLDNVRFAGKIPNKDIYTILKHAKICFVSLVNDKLKDSVPTKMFEALGVGCPVLLAAAGDAADILEECKLGKVVAPNDDRALWDAFLYMYHNMPEITRYRDQAREIVCTKYSRQKAAARLEAELSRRFSNVK